MQQQLTMDFERLGRQRLGLAQAVLAVNTQNSYRHDWRDFCAWCEQTGKAALPASAETVCYYLTDLIVERKRKVSTAYRRVTSILHMHREGGIAPPITAEVWGLLRGAARTRKEQPQQKAAISLEDLRRICAQFPAEPRAVRNKAILLLGVASALRRSNLAALDVDDVVFADQGMQIEVRQEKQDPEGKGRRIGVPFGRHAGTCAVRAVGRWLEVRAAGPGALFTHAGSRKRLTAATICDIVQRAVAGIGRNQADYGAHSLHHRRGRGQRQPPAHHEPYRPQKRADVDEVLPAPGRLPLQCLRSPGPLETKRAGALEYCAREPRQCLVKSA
jgi:site-specific recombinase XerD